MPPRAENLRKRIEGLRFHPAILHDRCCVSSDPSDETQDSIEDLTTRGYAIDVLRTGELAALLQFPIYFTGKWGVYDGNGISVCLFENKKKLERVITRANRRAYLPNVPYFDPNQRRLYVEREAMDVRYHVNFPYQSETIKITSLAAFAGDKNRIGNNIEIPPGRLYKSFIPLTDDRYLNFPKLHYQPFTGGGKGRYLYLPT